jgi:hypothetical protein
MYYPTDKEEKILDTILEAEMPDDFTGSEDDWNLAGLLFYNYVRKVIEE